jgi:uncharacterized protein (TIGR03435 family)
MSGSVPCGSVPPDSRGGSDENSPQYTKRPSQRKKSEIVLDDEPEGREFGSLRVHTCEDTSHNAILRPLEFHMSNPKRAPRAKLFLSAITLSGLLMPIVAATQNPPTIQKLAFEVASIKEWQPNQPLPRVAIGIRFSKGSVYAPCSDLSSIVRYAYRLTFASPITGLPSWAKTQCGPNTFSVDATMPLETTEDQARQMMQSLLEDRFKMRIHWEKKDMKVLALTVAPGGFKGKVYDPKTSKPVTLTCPDDDPFCTKSYGRTTISQLPNLLSLLARSLIIDKTGITDENFYETNFMYASDKAEASSLPSLSTVLREKFGLLLKPQTAPVDVLFIDHVEKPSPN